ncbi:carbohydrate-binding module family 50 protein [Collybiopsis luxurians FD-317 M1]|nr:carbohydrate-binding module family 50 protein [Collybiopsis luxurians FD-317 M1]
MFSRLALLAMVTAVGTMMSARVLAQTSSCQAVYTVVSGDICIDIAAKFNVTTAALLAANPAVDAGCDNLQIGQQLCIPAIPSNCSSQYGVQVGDVCIDIADKFNITIAQLEAANSEIDPACDNLQPGQVLCIPIVSA